MSNFSLLACLPSTKMALHYATLSNIVMCLFIVLYVTSLKPATLLNPCVCGARFLLWWQVQDRWMRKFFFSPSSYILEWLSNIRSVKKV
jgi:hypothetical protein